MTRYPKEFPSRLVELITAPIRAQSIPIIFFFVGVHEDYHRPGDEPQKIDYVKMEKVNKNPVENEHSG